MPHLRDTCDKDAAPTRWLVNTPPLDRHKTATPKVTRLSPTIVITVSTIVSMSLRIVLWDEPLESTLHPGE